MLISNEDKALIKAMQDMKDYCKQCASCIECPMFDVCSSDNIRRFPRYWKIPEVE